MYRHSYRAGALLPIGLTLTLGLILGGQAGAANPETAERRLKQLVSGLEVYELYCARCHDVSRPRVGTDALGGRIDAGALAWHGTMERLHWYVSNYMPFDRPASLDPQDYYDVLAFLLYKHDLLPHDLVIGSETLGEVKLPAYR